jgi:hypothetical protein
MLHQFEYRGPHSAVEDVTILSEKHCWRTLGGLITENYLAAQSAIKDGCHLQAAQFTLRHPEVMLCDLSNVSFPLNTYPHDIIEASFDAIRAEVYLHAKNPEYNLIHGDDLAPEIAVSGSSSATLQRQKELLIEKIYTEIGITSNFRCSNANRRGIEKKTPIISAKSKVLEMYSGFCSYYSQFVQFGQWDASPVFNLQYIYDDHEVWRQIANLGDNKAFVLTAGLPLALGYVNATNDDNIFFTEVHRQNDASMMQKKIAFSGLIPEPPKQGTWVVIDKAYSGGSIVYAKRLLRTILGNDAKIVTVALFPKSLEAFASADYAVYAGRLIRVLDVIHELTGNFWHKQLLRRH